MHLKRILLPLFLFADALILLLHPEVSRTAVQDSLRLCIEALLPSLFPFLILTGFWHFPGNGSLFSGIWLPASIGGYPTGASLIAREYKTGTLSNSDAEHALFFCCNAGPAFTIGFLGISLLNSLTAGIFLYGVHLGTSFLLGRLFHPQKSAARPTNCRPTNPQSCDPAQIILHAGKTMGKICIFVVTFGIFTSHLLALLPSGLQKTVFSAAVAALCELTTGVNRLNMLPLPPDVKMIFSAVFLGWGGICVGFQTASVLKETDLSILPYLKGKLLHGLLSGAVVCLFLQPVSIASVWCLLPIVFLLGKSFSGKKALHGL